MDRYKYWIIGSLASISIILLIVFLSGSKKMALDTSRELLERAKNILNEAFSTNDTKLLESVKNILNKAVSTKIELLERAKDILNEAVSTNDTKLLERVKNILNEAVPTNVTKLLLTDAVENDSESTTNEPQSQPSNGNDECKLVTVDECNPKGDIPVRKRSMLLKYVLIEMTDNCRKSNANFYINCDGTVVNGLGWDVTNSDGNFLFVAFIGDFREKSPKKESIKKLKELLKNGAKDKKLDSDYKVLSIGKIDNDPSRMSTKLEDEVKTLEEYRDENVGDLFTVEIRSGRFPVVFKEEWSEERTQYGKNNTDPIKELRIQDGGKRCFSTESCVDSVRNIIELGKMNSTFSKSNFYVAEDGLAYESLGWGAQDNKALVVQFVGSYGSTPPFQQALLAFRRLIKLGVWLGDISHDYEVIFSPSVGTKLKDELHKKVI